MERGRGRLEGRSTKRAPSKSRTVEIGLITIFFYVFALIHLCGFGMLLFRMLVDRFFTDLSHLIETTAKGVDRVMVSMRLLKGTISRNLLSFRKTAGDGGVRFVVIIVQAKPPQDM